MVALTRRARLSAVFVAAVLALAGCGSSDDGAPATGAATTTATAAGTATATSSDAMSTQASVASTGGGALSGTTWMLTTATDGTGKVVAADSSAKSTLTITGAQMAVFTGCNNGSATVTVSDTQLVTGPMAMTMMACAEPGVTELEHLIGTVLASPASYSLTGDSLTISNDAGSLVYRADTTAASSPSS